MPPKSPDWPIVGHELRQTPVKISNLMDGGSTKTTPFTSELLGGEQMMMYEVSFVLPCLTAGFAVVYIAHRPMLRMSPNTK